MRGLCAKGKERYASISVKKYPSEGNRLITTGPTVSRITRGSLARTIYRPSTSVETSVSLHQRYRERSKDNGPTSKLTITLSSNDIAFTAI